MNDRELENAIACSDCGVVHTNRPSECPVCTHTRKQGHEYA